LIGEVLTAVARLLVGTRELSEDARFETKTNELKYRKHEIKRKEINAAILE
jgi:hypothetical protein